MLRAIMDHHSGGKLYINRIYQHNNLYIKHELQLTSKDKSRTFGSFCYTFGKWHRKPESIFLCCGLGWGTYDADRLIVSRRNLFELKAVHTKHFLLIRNKIQVIPIYSYTPPTRYKKVQLQSQKGIMLLINTHTTHNPGPSSGPR